MSNKIDISLLITLYKGSDPGWFDECLQSVYCQKEYITEVVLVADGALTDELNAMIQEWEQKWSFRKVYLAQNYGPGGASQHGLEFCRCEWVARLDADDIASPNRFALQTEFLLAHPEVDVLGGYMPEFKGTKEQTYAVNYVPLKHAEIAKRLTLRSPMVNSSSIFRRSKALAAGGYEFMMSHEDHLLWMALLHNEAVFANLPKLMGYYRASPEYYKRRRGWNVIVTEFVFQRLAWQRGYISRWQYITNICLRVPPRLLPASMLEAFYNIFLRHSVKYKEL